MKHRSEEGGRELTRRGRKRRVVEIEERNGGVGALLGGGFIVGESREGVGEDRDLQSGEVFLSLVDRARERERGGHVGVVSC